MRYKTLGMAPISGGKSLGGRGYFVKVKALEDFYNERLGRMIEAKDVGGFVSDYHNLSEEGTCWVDDAAFVKDKAFVCDDAYICDEADISGCARVSGKARVGGCAEVSDNAHVFSNALVGGNAKIKDDALIHGNAVITGNVVIGSNASVSGDAMISGCACIGKDAVITKSSHVICITLANIAGESIANVTLYKNKHDKVSIMLNERYYYSLDVLFYDLKFTDNQKEILRLLEKQVLEG